jgi:hypothetical protein
MRHSVMFFTGLLLSPACLAQAPPSAGLSLAGGKTVYKIGEPILLRLTFTAPAGATLNVTTTDPASPVDQLVVSPMRGVFEWLADQDDGHPYSPDYLTTVAIEPGKSQIVDLPLNAVYRFDAGGHYSVHVVTRRIQGSGPLTTNTVVFDVEPMTDEEEASRAVELEAKIRHARNLEIARGYAGELDWLTGDPSTRVKLALYLHEKSFYPFAVDVTKGLWIARNRAFIVAQLEKALQDPTQDLWPASGLLGTAVALRARLDAGASRPAGSLREREVEAGYLKQIAASLPQRTGTSLVTAAQTVFIRLAQRNEVSGTEFGAAREVVVAHFADVNEYNVDWMLNAYGAYLQDLRMVPALKQILASQKNPVLSGERTAVMKQLVKLAPGDSRAEVVAEVCGDNPSMIQIFDDIPFSTLPETVPACRTRWLSRPRPTRRSPSSGPPHLPPASPARLHTTSCLRFTGSVGPVGTKTRRAICWLIWSGGTPGGHCRCSKPLCRQTRPHLISTWRMPSEKWATFPASIRSGGSAWPAARRWRRRLRLRCLKQVQKRTRRSCGPASTTGGRNGRVARFRRPKGSSRAS